MTSFMSSEPEAIASVDRRRRRESRHRSRELSLSLSIVATTASTAFHFSASPSGSGGENSSPPLHHKRVRYDEATIDQIQTFQIDATESIVMDPMEVNTQKPLRSYASTLLNPVRSFFSHPVENLSIGAEDYTITDDNVVGQTESVNMNMETANEVPIPIDVDKQGAHLERQNMLEVNKDDMGPWMVMSYKTQKKNIANNVGMKGKKTSGSRFFPLQTEDENIANHLTNSTPNLEAGTKTSEKKIVKFWKQVQEKTHIALSKGQPIEKNENQAVSIRVSSSSRTPLQEISNAKNSGTKNSRSKMKGPANNGGNFDAANSLVTSTTVHGVPKPVFSDLKSPLKFSRNADDASTSFGATFGHVPPDETQNVEASVCEMMINVDTDNQITFGSEPTEQVLATSQNTRGIPPICSVGYS
ncbi:hypothetical protein M0R45_034904 [Rubus argutus]|uniref:Uncharacterized protein n=1 Tax=Rubus argutus TaxID=59490 RepID=A0AAW1VVW7_RUBAR